MKRTYTISFLIVFCLILICAIALFQSVNYPMSYKNEIESMAMKYKVDGALIASVANVESGFNPNAKSSKGAVGIMQILPSTARWVAEKRKFDYQEELLFEPTYNIEIGTIYLSYLIDYFDDIKLAICAYNAGQGNVLSWLGNSNYSLDGKNLNVIPFGETKSYLTKVYKNYYYYKNRYN